MATLKLKHVDITERHIRRIYQWNPAAADNYVAGGFVQDMTKSTNPANAPRGIFPALFLPTADRFNVGNQPAGYKLEIIVNTVAPTAKNYLFKIFDISANPGAELAAAGFPAGIYNDVNGFTFELITPKKWG